MKGSKSKFMSQVTVANESTAEDSASTDEEIEGHSKLNHSLISIAKCQEMTAVIKVKEGRFRVYELDSRVGLNGSKSLEKFDCLMETENKRFFVWLGDISIDKFTKTTFLNIVQFAEKAGASSLVIVQNRDHV